MNIIDLHNPYTHLDPEWKKVNAEGGKVLYTCELVTFPGVDLVVERISRSYSRRRGKGTIQWHSWLQPRLFPIQKIDVGDGIANDIEDAIERVIRATDIAKAIDKLGEYCYSPDNAREVYRITLEGECVPYCTMFPHQDLEALDRSSAYVIIEHVTHKRKTVLQYQYRSSFYGIEEMQRHEPPAWLDHHVEMEYCNAKS